MKPLSLLVVAVCVIATPALADEAAKPASSNGNASNENGGQAPDLQTPPAPAPDANEMLKAIAGRDAPGDVPRPTVPPPVDEELMKELPPPSMGAAELIGPLAKTMLMLCVVLAIVYLTLHKGLGKLVERQNAGKRVRVVERVTLDQKRSLFLVEVDGKQMLIAAGEGGIIHLKDVEGGEVRTPAAAATGSGLGAKFADALKSKIPGAQPPVTTGLSRTAEATVATVATATATTSEKAGGVS